MKKLLYLLITFILLVSCNPDGGNVNGIPDINGTYKLTLLKKIIKFNNVNGIYYETESEFNDCAKNTTLIVSGNNFTIKNYSDKSGNCIETEVLSGSIKLQKASYGSPYGDLIFDDNQIINSDYSGHAASGVVFSLRFSYEVKDGLNQGEELHSFQYLFLK